MIISAESKSQLIHVSTEYRPMAEVIFSKRSLASERVDFESFIAVKGIKAQGNQFSVEKIRKVNTLPALPYTEPVEEEVSEEETSKPDLFS